MVEDYPIKKAQRLRFLNQISTRLQSLLQSENFYQEIVNIIQSNFHFYSVHIWSSNPDGSAALRAQAGAYSKHMKIGYTLRSDAESITGYVIKTRKSYLSNDVSQDVRFTNLSFPVETRSQLCIPIIKDDQPIAVLSVESDQIGAFDEDDVITLEAVAAQVAVAITNARLFQEVSSFNRNLKSAVEEKTRELQLAQERILEQQKQLESENKTLKSLVQKHESDDSDPVGNSAALINTLAMVDKIAPTKATVLIQGESGTGKELIARRLHVRSDRVNKAFVTLNCGALQESLLESELFGHEKGAFTGAVSQKIGLAEVADGGTLFLDEIGELSLGIQTKLLRFLQEGEFYRIGGKRPIRVDVRIISATNRDLEQEVKQGRFREDLFYRLNTITLRVPPLRKRKEDIPALVEHFLKNSRFGGGTHELKRMSPRVLDALVQYDWPGNIRELQNTVERLKILSENNEIRLDDVPFNIRAPKVRSEIGDFRVDQPLEDVEKTHILRTLAFNQGNKTKTAKSLGITIKTLYNKLHRYGVIESDTENTTHVES